MFDFLKDQNFFMDDTIGGGDGGDLGIVSDGFMGGAESSTGAKVNTTGSSAAAINGWDSKAQEGMHAFDEFHGREPEAEEAEEGDDKAPPPPVDEKTVEAPKVEAKATETALPEGMTAEDVELYRALTAEAKKAGFDTPRAYLDAQADNAATNAAKSRQEQAETKWDNDLKSGLLSTYQTKIDAGEMDVDTASALMNRDYQIAKQNRILADREFQLHQNDLSLKVRAASEAEPVLKVAEGRAERLVHNLVLSGLIRDVPTAAREISDIVKAGQRQAVADYIAQNEKTRQETAATSIPVRQQPSGDRTKTANKNGWDTLTDVAGRAFANKRRG